VSASGDSVVTYGVSRLVFALFGNLCRRVRMIGVSTLGVEFPASCRMAPEALHFIQNLESARRLASVISVVSYGVPRLVFALF
jgi:hypothetical protein